jgi:hypothetical protein
MYVSTWDNGIFRFTIGKDNTVTTDVTLFKNDSPRKFKIDLPDYIREALVQHHEQTNSGALKDSWKPWQTLEIRSPHNDLPFDQVDDLVIYS